MIVFHDVVQICNLADCDRRVGLLVIALDRCFMSRTASDGDRLGHTPVTANRLDENLVGGLLVTLLGEPKVKGLAVLINGTIERCPLALDFDLRLVHTPTGP